MRSKEAHRRLTAAYNKQFRASLTLCFLCAAALLALPETSTAERREVAIGSGWKGVSSIEDGRFLACSANKYDPDGMSVAFFLNARGELTLWLYKRIWRLSREMGPDLSIRVDRTKLRTIVNKIETDGFVLNLPDTKMALEEITAGRSITSSWRGTDVSATLDGSGKAVNFVIECVKNFGSTELIAKLGLEPKEETASDEKRSGSGFFVSASGQVLTNAHVVANCKEVTVSEEKGDRVPARVMARDEKNDLALLDTGLEPPMVAKLRRSPRLGENIYAFGYPLAGLLSSSGNFTSGGITAVSGIGDDTRILQISAPVQPGSSGGPLLDQAGNVVGIVVSKLNVLEAASVLQDLPQNVNFAVKSDVALTFMKAHEVPLSEGTETDPLSAPDVAEMATKTAVVVRCN
jgi:S1-C subfamily serine protease